SMSLWWGLLRAHQRLALSGVALAGVAFSGVAPVAAPVLELEAPVPGAGGVGSKVRALSALRRSVRWREARRDQNVGS
ncbi:hypothetical protein O4090_17810, partial [Dietzia kunjamensis]|uniref:hypothetical protein n=1 Tax=Dietzia kunjamensis TaxID=322509 RepID=UPI0022B2E882